MANLQTKPRPSKRSHQWVDARDLKMARLIAEEIRRNPAKFQEAVKTLKHWKVNGLALVTVKVNGLFVHWLRFPKTRNRFHFLEPQLIESHTDRNPKAE